MHRSLSAQTKSSGPQVMLKLSLIVACWGDFSHFSSSFEQSGVPSHTNDLGIHWLSEHSNWSERHEAVSGFEQFLSSSPNEQFYIEMNFREFILNSEIFYYLNSIAHMLHINTLFVPTCELIVLTLSPSKSLATFLVTTINTVCEHITSERIVSFLLFQATPISHMHHFQCRTHLW